jgi:hypothetical protein
MGFLCVRVVLLLLTDATERLFVQPLQALLFRRLAYWLPNLPCSFELRFDLLLDFLKPPTNHVIPFLPQSGLFVLFVLCEQ